MITVAVRAVSDRPGLDVGERIRESGRDVIWQPPTDRPLPDWWMGRRAPAEPLHRLHTVQGTPRYRRSNYAVHDATGIIGILEVPADSMALLTNSEPLEYIGPGVWALYQETI